MGAVREQFGTLIDAVDQVDLSRLLSEAGEAIAYVDADWVVRYCNDVYLTNLGLSAQEVMGRTPFEFSPQFHRSIFYEVVQVCRSERRPVARIGFSTLLHRWLMVRVFPVGPGLLMLANDASESVVKQFQLAQQAVKDSLTGLGNKLAMVNDMDALLEQQTVFSVAVMGLNRFRRVNELHGYAAGDMALMEVVSRLQSATLPSETLYRLGGDKLAVIARQQQVPIQIRALELMAAVRVPISVRGQNFVFGSSVGTAKYPVDGADSELLLKRASLALRQTRTTGQDEAVAYRPEMELASQLHAELETDLRVALKEDQLVLHLQPQVALPGRNLIGAEALIRWNHPKRGLLSPADFLGVAQDSGLMPDVDRWVIKRALQHVGAMSAQGVDVPVGINLSVDSLADEAVIDSVQEALRESRVEAHLLEIEIPEGALMRDVERSIQVLEGLHKLGARITIDDFGTGYSSFAYLARFPVQGLKIDRSFVKQMSQGDVNHTIVKSLVRLAHSLSLTVVAEGTETDDQIDLLTRMHCDSIQGYRIARPMPFDKFCAFALANGQLPSPNPFSI